MAQAKPTSFWKMLRVAILLIILFVVALNTWRDKNQDWSQPIFVALYPINADQSAASAQYIQQLQENDLIEISNYLQKQSLVYRPNQPVYFYFKIGQEVHELPPQVPENGSVLDVMLWSLKFRYYAWQQKQDLGFYPSVSLFLNFYDAKSHKVLKHSTALENGRIGIVNLFANAKQSDQNKIVVAHELLHAFGASDKYDLATGQPIFPIGYAEPERSPLYPQTKAEIMAVAVPLDSAKSKMANHLNQTLVSELTAQEIGWIKP